MRAWIYARDGHRCVRCGRADELQIDHIQPRALGGGTMVSNLRTLCGPCNRELWQRLAWYNRGGEG